MKSILSISVALLALLFASVAGSKTLIQEFRGDKTMNTREFRVEGPWLLDWRLDGDYDGQIFLDISLIDARTNKYVGRVLRTKYRGNGVKLFEQGGVYKLRISSTLARWRVKIEQITEEEAELYTPKEKK
ncbi:MAG: hypothetical protein ACE5F8_05055 [Woeseiaceae bacterium]